MYRVWDVGALDCLCLEVRQGRCVGEQALALLG